MILLYSNDAVYDLSIPICVAQWEPDQYPMVYAYAFIVKGKAYLKIQSSTNDKTTKEQVFDLVMYIIDEFGKQYEGITFDLFPLPDTFQNNTYFKVGNTPYVFSERAGNLTPPSFLFPIENPLINK